MQRAADGWPAVEPGAWTEVESRFRGGLTRLTNAAEEPGAALDERLTPAIDFPALAHYSRRDVIVHVATHNAHHLGQVILLRQLPAGGGHAPSS